MSKTENIEADATVSHAGKRRLPNGAAGFILAALVLVSPVGFMFLLPVLYVVYNVFVPVCSAQTRIDALDAMLKLKFYRDAGRYLTIETRSGGTTVQMCGYDWAHRARTSLYLTSDKNLVVMGPDACDYLISMEPLRVIHPFKVASDDWTYLGAFDLDYSSSGARELRLRFIPATEQEECLYPMVSVERFPVEWNRNSERKKQCPPPPPGKDLPN
jgi:hypothetical protein